MFIKCIIQQIVKLGRMGNHIRHALANAIRDLGRIELLIVRILPHVIYFEWVICIITLLIVRLVDKTPIKMPELKE